MPAITDDVLLTISGTIEKMLLEQQEGIDFAYQKIPDGIKISIGVNLDPTSQGVEANYTVNYPLEAAPEPAMKRTVKKKQIIDGGQLEMNLQWLKDNPGDMRLPSEVTEKELQ